MSFARRVAANLDLPLPGVERVIELLDAQNTVPFVARYRKEVTGGLDEVQIRAIAERRHGIPFHEDEADCYEGFRGRHRVLRLPAGLAAGLGVAEGGLVELLGRHPAPLRAWVRIVEGGPEGSLPLDAFARRVLGLVGGDEVVLRPLSMPVIPGDMTGFA